MHTRRAVTVLIGLAIAGGLGGLAGGVASAHGVTGASGAQVLGAQKVHVKPGGRWTFIWPDNVACEIVTFAAGGTFESTRYHDAGFWKGGRKTITMNWSAGRDRGAIFDGTTYVDLPPREYQGTTDNGGYSDTLIDGALSSYDGHRC